MSGHDQDGAHASALLAEKFARAGSPTATMVAGRPRSVLVALLARSCASIAVGPPTRISVDAAAYGRAKRRAVSEGWTQKLEVDAFLRTLTLTRTRTRTRTRAPARALT